MVVSVTVTGVPALLALLTKGQQAMGDWRPVLDDSAKAWYKEADIRFRAGDSTSSFPGTKEMWRPLSHRRVAERGGRAHPILIDTGALYNAATGGGGTTGQLSLWGSDIFGSRTMAKSGMTMELSGDKVANNFGFTNSEGFGVPQREFWGWESSEHDLLFEPFEKWADSWLGP